MPTDDKRDAKRHPYRSAARRYDLILGPVLKGTRVLGVTMSRPQAGMAVLDVGCGTGAHLKLYQRAQADLTGIDASPAMIEVARQKLGDSAKLHLGDASDMPYGDRSFDLVFSMLALHEMDPRTRSAVIDEMKRVLKKSGRILLIDFHPGPFHPLSGWIAKLVIHSVEAMAGGDHFRNYLHFIKIKGLPTLISEHDLAVEEWKVVAGGAMALYLLSPKP